MKWINKVLRGFQIFLGIIVSLVTFDMLVLGGKIKLWIIAVANTTSASPFSTDGQSNWIFILLGLGVILLIYLILKEKKQKG
jgi:LPXTG-motif cell wall-anchored protein